MKVSENQKHAKAWNNALQRLNSAQAGQIQITYQGADGKKQVGYTTLFDLEIEVNNKKITLGEFFQDLLNFNMETLKLAKSVSKAIDSTGKDLLIVKTDELGFAKSVVNYNANDHIVIATQPIPSDLENGYYYIKNGKFELSETRKLELYPDYV
jgi:ABC-type transport system substrate-binding protein